MIKLNGRDSMAKIISKKNIEPVIFKCECGTVSQHDQRKEVNCDADLRGGFFTKSIWVYNFTLKCPTCHKTVSVPEDNMDAELLIEKKKEIRTIISSSAMSRYDW